MSIQFVPLKAWRKGKITYSCQCSHPTSHPLERELTLAQLVDITDAPHVLVPLPASSLKEVT